MTCRAGVAVALSLILILGLAARCYRLGAHGFWLDECYSAEISAGHGFNHMDLPTNRWIEVPPDLQGLASAAPWWRVATNQGRDNSPPFYFLVLRGWRELFGSSDIAMRLLSVLCSLGAVALAYFATAELHPGASGLWAALLMALATSELELGRQARPYAMLTLFGVAALCALARIERRGWTPARGGALCAAAAATLVTHWLSLGWVVGLAVYAAVGWRGVARRGGLAALAVAALIAGIAALPLEIHQIRFAAHMTWWLQDRQPHHAARVLAALAELPLKLFGQSYGSTRAAVGWWIVFLLAPAFVALGRRRDLLLPTVTLFATLAVPVIVDLCFRTFASTQMRYVILAVPAMCLMLPRLLTSRRGSQRWAAHLLPAAVACFSAVSLFTFYREPINEDWRELSSLIARNASPGEPIIFACLSREDPEALPATVYLCASRYLAAGHPVYLATRPLSRDDLHGLHSPTVWMLSAWSGTASSAFLSNQRVLEFKLHYPEGFECHVALDQ